MSQGGQSLSQFYLAQGVLLVVNLMHLGQGTLGVPPDHPHHDNIIPLFEKPRYDKHFSPFSLSISDGDNTSTGGSLPPDCIITSSGGRRSGLLSTVYQDNPSH